MRTMATAHESPTPSEDTEEKPVSSQGNRYVCPICLESIRTPRSLPCLHTFCEDCLQTFITAAVSKDTEDVACPVCRKRIVAPELGLPHEKWAKSFPLNYFLSTSFLEPESSTRTEIKKENCRICERSNKLASAEHYCKNCAEAICDACKNQHQNFRTLKNHLIVTLEHFEANPSIPENDEMCQHHPSKTVEVYCLDHNKMCCSVCFATKHRHCKDVKSIEECAEHLSEDVVTEVVLKLESLLQSVDEEIQGKEKQGEKLTKSKDGALVKMFQCIEAAKKNLDILYQKFESELDGKYSADKSELQNILKMLQGIKTSLVGDTQMLEIAKKYGSKTQVFITLEKVKMQIDEQLKQISDAASGSITEDYSIDSKKAEEVCGLTSVGYVRSVLSSIPAVAKSTLDKLAAFTSNPDSLKRQRLLEIETHLIKWEVKWNYILPDVSYGATFLDRKVAMVTIDKRIIILNEDDKELCEHNIHCVGEPADINSTSENNVFISFKKQAILKEYYIDEKRITELRTISFEDTVEGFCIFHNLFAHASSSHVCVSDRNGKLIKRMSSSPQGDIGFLVGSSNQGIYYHTDESDVCCQKLNEDTATKVSLSAYTSKPRGIGIDFQGNVYVCSYDDPNKLLQISSHGSKVRVALYVKCYTIAFHPDGMSFVLTDTDRNAKFYVLSECSH